MTDDAQELLSRLHALENAELERARLMRKQHALIGELLRAESKDAIDKLAWDRARVGDQFTRADQAVRDLTAQLIEAIEQAYGRTGQ
jgi:hypothetical protein